MSPCSNTEDINHLNSSMSRRPHNLNSIMPRCPEIPNSNVSRHLEFLISITRRTSNISAWNDAGHSTQNFWIAPYQNTRISDFNDAKHTRNAALSEFNYDKADTYSSVNDAKTSGISEFNYAKTPRNSEFKCATEAPRIADFNYAKSSRTTELNDGKSCPIAESMMPRCPEIANSTMLKAPIICEFDHAEDIQNRIQLCQVLRNYGMLQRTPRIYDFCCAKDIQNVWVFNCAKASGTSKFNLEVLRQDATNCWNNVCQAYPE